SLSATQEAKDQRPKTKDEDTTVQPFVLGPSSFVTLRVRDTGSGIEAEDLPYIFDRFYRADKARQRVDSNASGLGLAIAKAIVEAHGGTLVAESSPGAGTTFTITLPAVVGQAQTGDQELDQRRHKIAGPHKR